MPCRAMPCTAPHCPVYMCACLDITGLCCLLPAPHRTLPPAAASHRSLPDAAAGLAEASAALQKEYQSHGTLRGRPLPVLVRMPDPELGATSSALRVWQQQVELVQGVFAYMCALQGV